MYYISWTAGSCQDGDRNGGLIECESHAEVVGQLEELKDNNSELSYTVIHGTDITEQFDCY